MKKKIMWICSVIGAGAVMSLVFGAISQRKEPEIIAVNGECNASTPKDKTAITMRVTVVAPTAVESMKAATNHVKEITDTVKDMPVEVQTTQFNSYEKTEWNREEQKSVTLGIETSISVEISANDINQIETVLNNFAGTQNVYAENLRMYTSQEALKPVVEKCLGTAVENARIRANALASGDGKKAGKMLTVAYGTNLSGSVMPISGVMQPKLAIARATSVDTAGTLVSKDTEVTVSVNAVFEIK